MHRFTPEAAARAKTGDDPPPTPGFTVGRDGGLHAFVSLPSPADLHHASLVDLVATHFTTLAPFCEHVRRIIDDTP